MESLLRKEMNSRPVLLASTDAILKDWSTRRFPTTMLGKITSLDTARNIVCGKYLIIKYSNVQLPLKWDSFIYPDFRGAQFMLDENFVRSSKTRAEQILSSVPKGSETRTVRFSLFLPVLSLSLSPPPSSQLHQRAFEVRQQRTDQ